MHRWVYPRVGGGNLNVPAPARPPGVYPRVGGGNHRLTGFTGRHRGLSPRGRGKPGPATSAATRRRSIPRGRGETTTVSPQRLRATVYPRVGGGNAPDRHQRTSHQVYPRVRGGNSRSAPFYQSAGGLSPRGRGKRRIRVTGPTPPYGGLSPRGRGKRFPLPRAMSMTRSIPAWAGETSKASVPAIDRGSGAVYPRVGGGNVTRTVLFLQHIALRSIPAWAGETPPRYPGRHRP